VSENNVQPRGLASDVAAAETWPAGAILWAVHVIGPDEWIGFPDFATAAERAHAMNDACLVHGIGNDVEFYCNVEPWPHGPTAHANSCELHSNWGLIDTTKPCNMGAGCDESGACFAAYAGKPDLCGKPLFGVSGGVADG
jgi:hypothetical protein